MKMNQPALKRQALESLPPTSTIRGLSWQNVAASTPAERLQFFLRVWAVFGILLFVSTWKLWTPQTQFPQIPFFEFLVTIPGTVDWIALALLATSLIGCLFMSSRSLVQGSLWIFAISASTLILLNQHRLQPWAYQYVIFAILMATANPKTAFTWMKWIVISIYIYSAISKLDYQYIHTVGEQMLWSLASSFGIDTSTWPESVRHWIVVAFPLIELLIGVGLSIPVFRKFSLYAAATMHLTLIVTLMGNVDGAGVLVWNLFFIAQAFFLFQKQIPRGPDLKPATAEPTKRKYHGWVASVISLGVVCFPLSEPLGICDHWPAWQVYAPRSSRAKINSFMKPPEDVDWSNIPAWSNRTLRVPVYPQARFQLAVAIAATEKYAKANRLPIEVSGVSDRWSGIRLTETLTGPDQFAMYLRKYWLNTRPRSFGRETNSVR